MIYLKYINSEFDKRFIDTEISINFKKFKWAKPLLKFKNFSLKILIFLFLILKIEFN